jgi:hypothetical protein
MPTWWLIGVAVYVPLFLIPVIDGVRNGDDEPWTAVACSAFYLATGVGSAFLWFG